MSLEPSTGRGSPAIPHREPENVRGHVIAIDKEDADEELDMGHRR